ncbi:MAG: hypothetical protein QGF59_00465, partial [Pirellulaceae bacterium]|nr:hypothetical protein [Pirellulaceae bacterium]
GAPTKRRDEGRRRYLDKDQQRPAEKMGPSGAGASGAGPGRMLRPSPVFKSLRAIEPNMPSRYIVSRLFGSICVT